MIVLLISLGLAFLTNAAGQVASDLLAHPLERPLWAQRPTLGGILLTGSTWFLRDFLDSRRDARSFSFSLLGLIFKLARDTGVIWCCLALLGLWLHSLVLRAALSLILIILIGPMIFPILDLMVMPVFTLLAIAIDGFFSRRPAKSVGDAHPQLREKSR